jgi:hypothetical protein
VTIIFVSANAMYFASIAIALTWDNAVNMMSGLERRRYRRNLGTAYRTRLFFKSKTRIPRGTVSIRGPVAETRTRSTRAPVASKSEATVSIARSAPPPRKDERTTQMCRESIKTGKAHNWSDSFY